MPELPAQLQLKVRIDKVRKRFISILAILALMLCVVPLPALGVDAVTLNTVAGANQGANISITGTTTLSKVLITVVKPDNSLLYVGEGSGPNYSQTLTIPTTAATGTYKVVVGQGSNVKSTTFVVSAAAVNPGGNGGGSSTPTTPTTPPPTTTPTSGQVTAANTTVISATAIVSTVATVDGKTVETITVKETVKTEIAKAISDGKAFVQISVAPDAKTEKTVVTVPAAVVDSAKGLGIAIATPNATLEVPKAIIEAFAKAGKELSITVEKGTAAAAASQMTGVKGAEGATVLGTPTVINADIKGSTTVSLPLTGITVPTEAAAQAAFLKSLAIFVVHDDGTKEVIIPAITKDAKGNPVAVSFAVDKFSTFAIIQVKAAAPVTPVVSLKDITGHWAEANIKTLVAAEAIKGYPDGSFKPNATITRAEFATVVVKAFKLAPKSGAIFSDTTNHWAKDAIATAAAYGIVNGYSATKFGPDDQVTREQMAVMLMKAAKLTPAVSTKSFSDQKSISSWAQEAVATATNKGIMSGYPDNTFAPQGKATRAEAATVIVKAMQVK